MNYYMMKYGLSASMSQSEIMQLIKSNGADAIQTSDGLFIKSKDEIATFNALLSSMKVEGVQLTAVNAEEAMKSEDTAPDIKVFIQADEQSVSN